MNATRRRTSWAGLSVAILIASSLGLEAQTGLTGVEVRGTVRNQAGEPLGAVAIEVAEESTGLVRTAATDADGRYAVKALPVGAYRLRVEHAPYRPLVRTELEAQVGQVVVVDVTLALAMSETTSVEYEAGAGDLAGAAVSSVVGGSSIEGLPTNGRDYVSFALLTPGVAAERTPPTGPTPSSGLSFAGQRARSNRVLVDGFDNAEAFTGAVAATFGQDAVREFEVLAASAPAEFGRGTGGTVNTITKSGTNEWHGSSYFFLRDDSLNSKEHFEKYDVFGNAIDAPKAPFHRKQWGATLGGPLRKDRTFLFLSYEQLDTDANNFVTIDPGVAAALEDRGFPVPLGSAPYSVGTKSALFRLDDSPSPNRRVLFRAHLSERLNEGAEPFGGIVARSHGVVEKRTDWGIAVGKTDIFGSGLLSEARLQVVRGDASFRALDPRCAGSCEGFDQGGPEILLSGLATAGRQANTPQTRSNVEAQLAETLSVTRGRHTLKAGFDFGHVWRDAALAQYFGATYVFTALPVIPGLVERPLTPLEAFERGLPAVHLQGYGDPTAGGGSHHLSLFVQDHWRLAPGLDLMGGLRYQHYDLGLSDVQVSNPAGATLVYDVPSRGNLAPRLSLSFDPTGRDRTSLTAAFGTYYEDPLLAVATVTQIIDGQAARLFQSGLPLSALAWGSPGHQLPEPASPFPSLVQVAGPGLRAPSARQISVGISQALGDTVRLSVDLIAVRARDQIGVVDYNPLVAGLGAGRRPDDVAGVAGTSASVNQFTNYGDGWYRGMTASLRKRMSHGFEALASYTLSKAEDTGSDMFGQANVAEDAGLGRDPADPAGLPRGLDPAVFRGPSAIDQRHRLVLSALGDLPWRLRLSGIAMWGSGRPYTALSGVDSNRNGVAANDRARRDPADPASRVGRNGETLPATATVDARLSRTFALSRGVALELLVEAFNLLDRVNYSDVNNVFGPGAFPGDPQRDSSGRMTYGRYTKAYPPRQAQIAARLTF